MCGAKTFLKRYSGPSTGVEHAANQLARLGLSLRHVGPNGCELEPRTLDVLAPRFERRDTHRVAATLQLDAQREVRM